MTTRDPSTSWIAQADADLEAARANAEEERYALACLLCHESAVKAVKGFLYKHQAELLAVDRIKQKFVKVPMGGNTAF